MLDELIYLSKNLGSQVSYVQGGGGNTSIKNSEGQFWVKASGLKLCEVSTEKGFSELNLSAVREVINTQELDDNSLTAKLNDLSLNKQRPSIETGMHALLNMQMIAHTHNVYLNVVTCANEGKAFVEETFGNSVVWIDYVNPGWELVKAFRGLSDQQKVCRVYFLQNHGIVVCGNSAEDILREHETVTKKVRDALKLGDFLLNEKNEEPRYLFPDQFVYKNPEQPVYKEIQSAAGYILKNLKALNWNPRYISDKKLDEIGAMDSEKFRQGLK